MLLHEKHARARATSLQELTKVSRHGLKVGGDQNATLLGSEGQHRGIRHTLQVCPIRRKKSIVGSRRKQPLTIAFRRLASAKNRTIRQLCRAGN